LGEKKSSRERKLIFVLHDKSTVSGKIRQTTGLDNWRPFIAKNKTIQFHFGLSITAYETYREPCMC
jgi:hypothetical protein